MPIAILRTYQTIRLVMKVQAKIATMPITCAPKVASGSVKQAASSPQMPADPCTDMAPTGSSILSLSRKVMENTTRMPPTAPTNRDNSMLPDSGDAVIETSPARAPFNAMVRSALPNSARARTSAATKPPQAAMLVLTNTCATALASSTLLTFSSEPPLKPNQPNQRMNMPSVANGMLAPGRAFTLPSEPYLPLRGPSSSTPASAAVAPHM